MLRDRVFVLLLATHVALLVIAAISQSPANHEVAQLPAGLTHWKFQRFELCAVNPPLVRMTAALPVSLLQPKVTWHRIYQWPKNRPEYAASRQFIKENGGRAFGFFIIGRLTCIPFSLIGACTCYLWALDLFGRSAARVASCLWCFSPTVLGDGSLITPDVPAAAFGLLTVFLFCKYLSQPRWSSAVLLGIAMGLSVSTKFTWLVVLPMIFTPAFLIHLMRRRSSFGDTTRVLAHLGCAMLVAVFVLNATYGFSQSPTRLGDVEFVSKALTRPSNDPHSPRPTRVNRFRGSCLERIIVPVPNAALQGIDIAKRDFEVGFRSYLMGHWKQGGWWYYYAVAISVKSPVACLLLVLAGTCGVMKSARSSLAHAMVISAPAIILIFVSSQTGFNHHMRYILPALPFGFVVAGNVVTWSRSWRRVAFGLLVCQIVSVVWCGPHWMSYFNALAGGPANGQKWLLHSNIDAGQDLLFLKRWRRDNLGSAKLHFAPNALFDPQEIGINFELPPPFIAGRPDVTNEAGLQGPQAGRYAVSVAQLNGQDIATSNGRGGWFASDGHYTYFQHFRPVGRCGYSIYLYHITEEQARSVRMRLGAMEPAYPN